MPHYFTLHAERDQKFIAQRWQEQFTHNVLRAGDEIVVCACHRTPFLRATWPLVCSAHGGLENTLTRLPDLVAEIDLTRTSIARSTMPRGHWLRWAAAGFLALAIGLLAARGDQVAGGSLYSIYELDPITVVGPTRPPALGAVWIVVQGKWANFTVGGGKVMETSLSPRVPVVAGTHVVRVFRPGFRTIVDTIEVPPGIQVDRIYTLQPAGP
jgi:PEGA domain